MYAYLKWDNHSEEESEAGGLIKSRGITLICTSRKVPSQKISSPIILSNFKVYKPTEAAVL